MAVAVLTTGLALATASLGQAATCGGTRAPNSLGVANITASGVGCSTARKVAFRFDTVNPRVRDQKNRTWICRVTTNAQSSQEASKVRCVRRTATIRYELRS